LVIAIKFTAISETRARSPPSRIVLVPAREEIALPPV
jgi:hypothetical protein